MPVRFSLLFIAVFFSLTALAQDIKPFKAEYKVFRGNSYIADSKLTLKKQQGEWIWRIDTKARGIYKWLTRKKPYIETRMQEIDHKLKLLLESSGDYPDKLPKWSSWFDHLGKFIYSMKGNKIKKQKLPEDVYNFHSIHLLYPQMMQHNEQQKTVNFFKKGKLLKSTLILEKNVELSNKKQHTVVDKLTQKFDGSKKYFIYYYKGKTLAPLKIEQINPGKDSSVMWRQNIK
jgi:hypothetical protein